MKTDGTNTIEFTYDKEGRQIEETRTAPYFDVLDDQVYAGGRQLVTYTGYPGDTHTTFQAIFDHADWQGTSRAKTLYNGNGYENCVNLPYGDGQVCNTAPTDPDPLHYTGKPRDTETGLDYFGARYYSSSMGHWMSPDWAGKPAAVPYANYGDPQSLNLYAMVTGNPVSRQDSDGHIMSSPYDAGSLWGGGGSGPQGCLANESADARGICGGESEQVLAADQTPQMPQEGSENRDDVEGNDEYDVEERNRENHALLPASGGPRKRVDPSSFEYDNDEGCFIGPAAVKAAKADNRKGSLLPDPLAIGPHTVFNSDPGGRVNKYTTLMKMVTKSFASAVMVGRTEALIHPLPTRDNLARVLTQN